MSEDALPQSLSEYLYHTLSNLHPNVRMVFIFDPPGRLALASQVNASGRVWAVFRYSGNDLAFRAEMPAVDDLSGPALIWVTARPGQETNSEARLDISSLADLLVRADTLFDLSLVGVLRTLAPGDTWPAAEVERHAEILSVNLPAVVEGHRELRRYLPQGAALDAHALRILALHALQPAVPIGELLFHKDTAVQVLRRYVRLAWGTDWNATGRELLREHALLSPQVSLGDMSAWFNVAPNSLAGYLYLRRFLGRSHVPNIANQLRGLGVLSFDPEPLEPWVEQVLAFWDRDRDWRHQIMIAAEQELSDDDLHRAVGLLKPSEGAEPWSALAAAEAPGILIQLAAAVLRATPAHGLDSVIGTWPTHRPQTLKALPDSRCAGTASALGDFLDETSAVVGLLERNSQPGPALAGLVDWYVEGGFYDLEFACARASMALRKMPDDDSHLIRHLQTYVDRLRKQARNLLQGADEELARRITQNWRGYLSDPRLATHVLPDAVKQRRLHPKADACVWVVIFDGMRWDSWQRVVKPRLLQSFELKQLEKAYLSVLPSWTRIARTSLLAGCTPETWQTPEGRFSYDPRLLAARLFQIPAAEVDHRLRIYSGMEADTTYRRLDRDQRFPWNVLIFNVSDDNLHQERSNLVSLNAKIAALLDDIMRTLELVVRPEDTVVLSSDHGFMELDDTEQDGRLIPDTDLAPLDEAKVAGHPVRYRYILGTAHDSGFAFSYPGVRESTITVAVGHRWFQREGANQRPDRYAHGGLSLAEMVVPGAVLKRIVQERIEVVFEHLPDRLEVDEGQTLAVDIALRNTGNRLAKVHLEVAANTDQQPQIIQETLEPGQQRSLQPVVRPVYRTTGTSTTYVTVTLKYQNAQGAWQSRRQDIPVSVRPRRDVIEIEYGGLEALDDLV